INGLYPYKDKLYIHAGNYLVYDNKILKNCFLPDTKSCGFESEGLLYIVCYGKLYVFDGENLTNVQESKYAYVPTTKKDISPINRESKEVEFECANLLTSRRKNTLIGVKENYVGYILDGNVDTTKPFSVKTKMRVKYGSQEENVSSYNAVYAEEKRLNTDNFAKVVGIEEDEAERLFSGIGTNVNLSMIGEIDVFLKTPIKVTSAKFIAKGNTGVPRITFFSQNEVIYDTQTVSEESELDLTSVLKDKAIDEIRFYGNSSIGVINKVEIFGKELYEGYVEISHHVESFEFGQGIKPVSITDANGKDLKLSQNLNGTFIVGCNLFVEKGIKGRCLLYFNFECVSESDTKSNIEVEYGTVDNEKLICNICELCKTDTGRNILALSDGTNLYLSSNKDGGCYIPENLKTPFGEITALCSKEGNMLTVFGKDRGTVIKITTKDGETVLSLSGHSLQGGAISHLSSKTVNNDTISLSNDGVFGAMDNSTKRVRRGENIKSLLPKNMENAVSVECGGCYYLFIDGVVFVADTRFKNYENNRLDSSFEYEWWYLDNVPANSVVKFQGEIFIGRKDGRVVKFYDGYSDILYESVEDGEYLFGVTDGGIAKIYLNKEIGANAFDTVLVSDCYTVLCDADVVERGDNKVVLRIISNDVFNTEIMKIYPDRELYLKNQEGELKKCKCVEIDRFTQTATVETQSINDTYTEILYKNNNEEYKLESENDYFVFLDKYGSPCVFYGVENARVLLEKETPVSVEYVSAPLLTEENDMFLYEIGVDLTEDSSGIVFVEYETDKTKKSTEIEWGKNLNFDDFDFGKFIFNSSLKKSQSFYTFERNFQYVILKIKHESNEEFGLVGYNLVYR
ncbi:MAG: hypothetical protein IKA02_00005, partial [Clostridia bacterium]|nr:hypothetical protein [Clostridia bacterium]